MRERERERESHRWLSGVDGVDRRRLAARERNPGQSSNVSGRWRTHSRNKRGTPGEGENESEGKREHTRSSLHSHVLRTCVRYGCPVPTDVTTLPIDACHSGAPAHHPLSPPAPSLFLFHPPPPTPDGVFYWKDRSFGLGNPMPRQPRRPG